MKPVCLKFKDSLSAYVDETLPEKRWEEISYHLAGCGDCRHEVLELRDLRSALAASCNPDVAAPSTLADRLEAIAGEHAADPLYISQGKACALPSKRRRRRKRAMQTGAALLAMTMAVAMLALVVAPEPRTILKPTEQARDQYAMYSTAVNVQEAVGAMLLAQGRGAHYGAPVAAQPMQAPHGKPLPISSGSAEQMMDHAAHTGASLTGTQQVWVTNGSGHFLTSDVQMSQVAGEGTHLVVLDADGGRFLSSFLPDFTVDEVRAPDQWRYFTYPALTEVVGRSAFVMEAQSEEVLAARWWIDSETGELLRSERFDTFGNPTIMVGFRELNLGEAQLPVDRSQLTSLSKASSSGARGWCVGFDDCPYELAGLPLVAYSSSPGDDEMSLIYSDGIHMISASWTDGVLQAPEPMSEGAASGLPSVSIWQAGDGVVSVATNGSRELLAKAVAGLPEQAPHEETLWQRFNRGMGRLTGLG